MSNSLLLYTIFHNNVHLPVYGFIQIYIWIIGCLRGGPELSTFSTYEIYISHFNEVNNVCPELPMDVPYCKHLWV